MEKKIEWEEYLAEDQPFPLPTDADVAALERYLGRVLPDDYKDVLKAHQGQTPEPGGIPIGKGGSVFGCLFHAFLSGSDMSYSVAANTKRMEKWGFKNYVAFTDDTGNSHFCFDYNASPTNPPIVFIDGDFEVTDPRSIIPIANSFTELLNMLEE